MNELTNFIDPLWEIHQITKINSKYLNESKRSWEASK